MTDKTNVSASTLFVSTLTIAVVVVSMLFAGCAKPPPKPLDRPALDTPLSLEVAVRMIAYDLFAQINNQHLPRALTLAERVKTQGKTQTETKSFSFATDAVMNGDTGEEIELSAQVNDIIKNTASNSFPQFSFKAMTPQSIGDVDLVILGVIKHETYNNNSAKFYRLYLSAVDMKSGQVKAHSEAWLANQDLKLLPTPLFADSPMFIRDTRSEKIIATATAATGSTVDKDYLAAMETNALLAEAAKAYDDGNHQEAVKLFGKAAEREDGQILKTYAGLYQAHLKLKQLGPAEDAFAKLAEIGIKNGSLSVKFLFQVNDTRLFGQGDELLEYDIWLRQLAKKIIESGACVEISGHASHTGSADYNKKLSEKRSNRIQKQMLTYAPEIARKTSAVGRGFEENIVGSGTDDIRDAIDRRVEFKVMECRQ